MLYELFPLLAQAAEPQPPGGGGSMLIPMVCVFVIMYFLMIRPQQKKQKELQQRVASLKTGDKVVTSGGIHGIVANVKDGATLSLKIADNVKIEVDKSAIAIIEGDPAPAAAAAKKEIAAAKA